MRDSQYVDYIIKQTKCNVIFHCAAYKHVPMMEENQVAAIENNVFGTKNLLDASLKHKVERFVLISTDKAVDPVSVYGVSKMLCEKMVLDAAKKVNSLKSDQAIMFVRFGNVLGSRGSILPLFQNQIKTGGPLLVTDEGMERFFMTIPEACQLVLEAISLGEGGEIFILDMGNPVKIVDLARDLITLSGLRPEEDIKIVFSGMRPGEKLFEELSVASENADKTKHPKIFVGHISSNKDSTFMSKILEIEEAAFNNEENIPERIKNLVPEYLRPTNG